MALSSCPRCGTPLQSGAAICTACGHNLSEPADSPDAPGPPPDAEGISESSSGPTAEPAGMNIDFVAIRDRWGVVQSPGLAAGLVLAVIALAIGAIALVSYLTADDSDVFQKLDASTWFRLALGLAIGSAALLVLARWQSPEDNRVAEFPNPDLQIGFAIGGLTVVLALAGLFNGFDEGFDAQEAWFSYAYVFAFVTVGWFALSRPVPDAVGTVNSQAVGVGLVLIGLALLGIGQIQALSDDFSDYISGLSLQSAGTVALILGLAWFLGMRPRPS